MYMLSLSKKQVEHLDRAIKETPSDGTVVYMLKTADDCVKIGWSRDASVRKHQLALGNSYKGMKILFEMPGSQAHEMFLLARFAHLSVDGREIIRFTDEVRNYIRRLKRYMRKALTFQQA